MGATNLFPMSLVFDVQEEVRGEEKSIYPKDPCSIVVTGDGLGVLCVYTVQLLLFRDDGMKKVKKNDLRVFIRQKHQI